MAEQKPGKKIGCGLFGCAIPMVTFIVLLVVIIPTSIFGIISGVFGKKFIQAPTVRAAGVGHFPSGAIAGHQYHPHFLDYGGDSGFDCFTGYPQSQTDTGRLQAAVEAILEWIYNFCKDIAGEKNGRKFFPVVRLFFFLSC